MNFSKIITSISKIQIYYYFLPCVAILTLIGIIIDLWGSYWFAETGGKYFYEIERSIMHKEIVPPYVECYKPDSCFIVAKQYPKGKYYLRPAIGRGDITYPDGYFTPYYWIVVKADPTVYGPCNYRQFTMKCDSLNIKLRLEDK